MGFSKSKQSSNNTSQQTSESQNQAYPFLQSSLGGQVANVGRGSDALANLLGLNGSGMQDEGFQRFKDSSGYGFLQDEAMRSVTGNAAARGMLGSGSFVQGLTSRANNLADQFLTNYMGQLGNLSGIGLGAAQAIGGAGNTSRSQGTSTGTSRGSSFSATLG